MRFAWVLLLTLLLAACTAPQPPIWETPAPPAPAVEPLAVGDPDLRPVFREFKLSPAEERNGWLVVPWASYDLLAVVERAERVVFHGFSPDTGSIDPDRNGIIDAGTLKLASGGTHWVGHSMSPGGQSAAIYAVAENEHGRSVSPVLIVAWQPSSDATAISPGDGAGARLPPTSP